VQKTSVGFGRAYLTMLFWSLITLVLIYIVDRSINAILPSQTDYVYVPLKAAFIIPPAFLVLARLVTSRIRIPFGRASLVSLSVFGLGVGLYSVFLMFAFIAVHLSGGTL
jgi:hypothetical protein